MTSRQHPAFRFLRWLLGLTKRSRAIDAADCRPFVDTDATWMMVQGRLLPYRQVLSEPDGGLVEPARPAAPRSVPGVPRRRYVVPEVDAAAGAEQVALSRGGSSGHRQARRLPRTPMGRLA